MDELGFVLLRLRRRKGWSQGQLAKKAETTPEYISQLERGKRLNPSAHLLTRLAVALDTTPDSVLTEAGLLPIQDEQPLPPEVVELGRVIEAYPPGAAKDMAIEILSDVANALRKHREGDTPTDSTTDGQPVS